jgi:hypothetical protein
MYPPCEPAESAQRRLIMIARALCHVVAPVTARGRNVLKARFAEGSAFKTWKTHKIVQLAKLLALNAAWKKQGRTHFKLKEIGDWLGYTDPKATTMAKSVLKDAIESLPALGTQIAQTMVQEDEAEALIADWIGRLTVCSELKNATFGAGRLAISCVSSVSQEFRMTKLSLNAPALPIESINSASCASE